MIHWLAKHRPYRSLWRWNLYVIWIGLPQKIEWGLSLSRCLRTNTRLLQSLIICNIMKLHPLKLFQLILIHHLRILIVFRMVKNFSSCIPLRVWINLLTTSISFLWRNQTSTSLKPTTKIVCNIITWIIICSLMSISFMTYRLAIVILWTRFIQVPIIICSSTTTFDSF